MPGSKEPADSAPDWGKALVAAGTTLTGGGGENGNTSSATADLTKAIAGDMAEIRKHLTRFGAVLGAAAVAIVGGLGYAQVHEAFPLPAGRLAFATPYWLIWLVVCLLVAAAVWRWIFRARMKTIQNVGGFLVLLGGILFLPWILGFLRGDVPVDVSRPRGLTTGLALGSFLAVGGAAWLASRFFGAQRRILIAPDDALTKLGDADERRGRDYFFGEVARGEGAASLRDLELRAARLDRVARRLPADSDEAKRASSEATSLAGVIELALSSAALWILECRSSKAFDGRKTKIALGMTVLGLVLVFGIADYAKGERELVNLRTKCQTAVKAGAIDACDPVRTDFNKAAVELRLAEAKEKQASAISDARTVLTTTPATPAARVDWIEACLIVLRSQLDPKVEPDLAAKCVALLSG